jgi:archaellum component FlaC
MTRKLDKEHLDAINTLQEQFKENNYQFGTISIELEFIETQRKSLEHRKSELFTQFVTLREQESSLVDQLKERYGEGQINIIDGTFTPDTIG